MQTNTVSWPNFVLCIIQRTVLQYSQLAIEMPLERPDVVMETISQGADYFKLFTVILHLTKELQYIFLIRQKRNRKVRRWAGFSKFPNASKQAFIHGFRAGFRRGWVF